MRSFYLSSRQSSFNLAALSLLVFVFSAFGQTSNQPQKLTLGQPIEHQIKGNERHTYQIELTAGQFLRVQVEQPEAGLEVKFLGANGKEIDVVNNVGAFAAAYLSFEVNQSGSYLLQIRAIKPIALNERYIIKTQILEKASEQDQTRMLAERLLIEAGRLRRLNEKESFVKANQLSEQALGLWRKLGDKYWEGITLNGIGLNWMGLGEQKTALKYYEQALSARKAAKDKRGEAVTLRNIGIVYKELKETQKAADFLRQAVNIYQVMGHKDQEAAVLSEVADVFYEVKEFQKAIEIRLQSAEIYKNLNDLSNQADELYYVASAYRYLNKFDLALDYYQQTLVIRRKIKDREGEGDVLMNLGTIHLFSLEQYEKALDYYQQALVIRREIKDRRGEGNTLIGMGAVYLKLRQYEKALDYYQQTLAIRQKIKDREGEGDTLDNLGTIYRNLGQFEKALDYYQQSLAIRQEIKDRKGEGNALIGLGTVHEQLKQYEKALDYYQQSLIISREIRDRSGEGDALDHLGIVHFFYLGQYEKALDYYQQALIVSREIKDRLAEKSRLNTLGIFYDRLGQYEKALDYYQQALIINREIKDRSGEGGIYWNLTLLAQSLKKFELSIFYGKQAVNIYQEIRGNIKGLDKESQKSFITGYIYIYRRLSDILISEGRFPEAQAVLDLLKDEEYKDLTRSSEKGETVPYSKSEADVVAKIDKLADLQRQQTELRKQQKELGDKFPSEQLKKLEQVALDIKAANAEFENALTALSKADTSVEARTLEIQSEKNLQSALQNLGKELNTGTVALYTVIGTEEEKDADGKPVKDKTRSKFGWVILVTSKDRKAYPIDVTNLEQLVFQFREALSSDKYDPRPLAEKLYTAIFRQTSEKQKVTLEEDLRVLLGKYEDKTIMWSLDGVLRYIPMAALHDGNQYLVEKYRNVVFTKESLLWLMNAPAQNAQALGLGVSSGNRDLNMTPLPGVEKELTDVVRQRDEKTGVLDGTRRLNNEFKRAEILNLKDDENPYRIVHIASHYSFNPTDQNSSYLLVGDGKLTFGDMKTENNLFGTVDLLTLSACDTGVSGNGKEAEGFAYLAQSLGAKSVIASLWKVSDAGTPELMIRFYKLRAENLQLSKGEAFRRAQLSLLFGDKPTDTKTPANENSSPTKGRSEIINSGGKKIELPFYDKAGKPPYAHPHYWASFVLIGNWR